MLTAHPLFGSPNEFIALKIAIELIESLRYKLQMIGIPIDSSTVVFCDNEAMFVLDLSRAWKI